MGLINDVDLDIYLALLKVLELVDLEHFLGVTTLLSLDEVGSHSRSDVDHNDGNDDSHNGVTKELCLLRFGVVQVAKDEDTRQQQQSLVRDLDSEPDSVFKDVEAKDVDRAKVSQDHVSSHLQNGRVVEQDSQYNEDVSSEQKHEGVEKDTLLLTHRS